jgi:Protein of unknown function (DUF559)
VVQVNLAFHGFPVVDDQSLSSTASITSTNFGADRERTEFLEALGYLVLRFSNHEVLEEPAVVLERLRRYIAEDFF